MLELYVDLDDVLADFTFDAIKLHGKDGYLPTKWDFYQDWGLSKKEFWDVVDDTPSFWPELSELPWMDQLLTLIKEYDENFQVLTAPINSSSCYSGKRRWVEYHVEINPSKRMCMYYNKSKLAAPNRVLIDDNETNIDKWIEKGGIGILFPSYYNKTKEHLQDPVSYVKKELEKASGLC